jgi:hypothetical protein
MVPICPCGNSIFSSKLEKQIKENTVINALPYFVGIQVYISKLLRTFLSPPLWNHGCNYISAAVHRVFIVRPHCSYMLSKISVH